jgi:fructose-bisphosphate aldolase class II
MVLGIPITLISYPMLACDFIKKTGVDCLAISYGTKHGAVKGKNVKLRREIAIATSENLRHAGILPLLVSHGSSTVPQYIVEKINKLGGTLKDTNGIPIGELKGVIPCGICKINVDTDIRLAITRNFREYFVNNPCKKASTTIGEVWSLLEKHPDNFDPRVYLTPIMNQLIVETNITDSDMLDLVALIKAGVHEVVGKLIIQFGSFGKADRIEVKTLEQMARYYNGR